MAGTTVTYNGNSLQTANILADDIDHNSLPDILAPQYNIAHDNQSSIPYIAYTGRTITLTGMIVGSSISDCDNQIDTFKSYLVGKDLPLVVQWAGGTRTYTATPTKVTCPRPGGLAYAEFTIIFTCNFPFGANSSTDTAWSATGLTSSPETNIHTFLGTAPYQLVIATITLENFTNSASNLLLNPGFEAGALTDWSSGGVGTATASTTSPHSGSYCMKMVNASTAVGGYYGAELQDVGSTTAGQEYTVSVWLKGAAGGETVVLSSENGSTNTVTCVLTTSWQQFWITLTAAVSSLYLNVGSTTASATWYMDDTSMTINNASAVFFGNATTGQGITVSRQWSIGDVLVIDCTQKAVTVNGNDIAWLGGFPEFAAGSQELEYIDGFTTRDFNIGVVYTPGNL